MKNKDTKIFSFFLLVFFIFGLLSPLGTEVSGRNNEKFYLAGLAVSDEGFEEQWYLDSIKAPDAWEITRGSRDVVVALIDTGIDLNHPDLTNNIWVNTKEIAGNSVDDDNNGYVDDVNGWDFVENDNTPEPNLKNRYAVAAVHHGTAVAGIIAAEGNNAFSGAGIAWQTRIMPLKAFSEEGESDTALVGAALEYAVRNGADIVNMSFVGLAYTSSLEEKIKAAYEKGVLLVAAAGNENGAKKAVDLDETKSYPVCHDGPAGENWVLGVAAIDKEDKKMDFSNYGKSCVDLTAPGAGIYSTYFQDSSINKFKKYFGGPFNGTSVAAPQVVGAAALVKALHPNYTNKELTQVLLGSVDNIDSANLYYLGKLGRGRINISKAVKAEAISMETTEEARVKYVLAAKAGSEPRVWLFDSKGDEIKNFYAFSPGFKGGVNLAVGDMDNDGMVEIVAGAGAGGSPHVRIFNLSGELEYQFYAFDKNRRGGVLAALGDIDGDGRNEIIAVEAGKTKPLARVLDRNGNVLKDNLSIFDKHYKNGISLAVSDVNCDGKDEIIGGTPQGVGDAVKIIDGKGAIVSSFAPFDSKFYGGINVAAGDLNNDCWAETVISKRAQEDSIIGIYNYVGKLLSPEFHSYDKHKYGVNISTGDRDKDKSFEILTITDGGRSAEIKILDDDFNLKMSFYPFGKSFVKGLSAYIVTR